MKELIISFICAAWILLTIACTFLFVRLVINEPHNRVMIGTKKVHNTLFIISAILLLTAFILSISYTHPLT